MSSSRPLPRISKSYTPCSSILSKGEPSTMGGGSPLLSPMPGCSVLSPAEDTPTPERTAAMGHLWPAHGTPGSGRQLQGTSILSLIVHSQRLFQNFPFLETKFPSLPSIDRECLLLLHETQKLSESNPPGFLPSN